MSLQLSRLDRYAAGMAEIQLNHNPLSQEIEVIFNDVVRDHYQDAHVVSDTRVKKQAVVKKNVDMNYVQELGGDLLLEDIDSLPWVVSLTILDLPRIPKMDDSILIDGIIYTISMVKPSNRNLQSILNLFVYPERVHQHESLEVVSVKLVRTNVLDILYKGNPKEMSFDNKFWFPFRSYALYDLMNDTLYLRNDEEFTSYSLEGLE